MCANVAHLCQLEAHTSLHSRVEVTGCSFTIFLVLKIFFITFAVGGIPLHICNNHSYHAGSDIQRTDSYLGVTPVALTNLDATKAEATEGAPVTGPGLTDSSPHVEPPTKLQVKSEHQAEHVRHSQIRHVYYCHPQVTLQVLAMTRISYCSLFC